MNNSITNSMHLLREAYLPTARLEPGQYAATLLIGGVPVGTQKLFIVR